MTPTGNGEREVLRGIERHGWIVQWIANAEPPFAYSVGMTPHGLPEVIMFGLRAETLQFFINEVCGRMLYEQVRYRHGDVITELSEGGQPLKVLDVDDTSALGAAHRFYQTVRALQLVYADQEGRFPWDEGYAFPLEEQPLLGRP
jgi:hypothetical protein